MNFKVKGIMKRGVVVGAVAIGGICGYQLNAAAGLKSTHDLSFTNDPVKPEASVSGAVGSVRNSSDASQYHGCTIHADPDGIFGTCDSRSGSTTRTCFTRNPNLIAAMMSIKGDSWLAYQYRTAIPNLGDCFRIEVENSSNLAPK